MREGGAAAGVADTDLSRVIPKALAVAAGKATVEVNGDGSAVRDFVHVDVRRHSSPLNGGPQPSAGR